MTYRFKQSYFEIGWFNDEHFFIKCNLTGMWDHDLADILAIPVSEYKEYMITNINAAIDNENGEIYFNTREDAEKALEWIENMYVMKKLRGEV